MTIFMAFSLFLQGCSGFETWAFIAVGAITHPGVFFKIPKIPKLIERTEDILVDVASRAIGLRFSVEEFGFLEIPIIHGLRGCFAVEG
jgi:hypothetical protein